VVAGGLALVLEAHPNWSLDKLYNGLRLTADNADAPNNDMGWGIARMFDLFAVDSYLYPDIVFFTAPSPAKDSVVFLFNLPCRTEAEISIFTVNGERIKVLRIPVEFTTEGQNRKSWDAKNNSGEKIASGVYIGYLKTAFDCCATKFAFVK
jgi:hypothetical protein